MVLLVGAPCAWIQSGCGSETDATGVEDDGGGGDDGPGPGPSSDAAGDDADGDAHVSDGGADAHVEPTYDPSGIPGLALWLRASDATPMDGGMMEWVDRSPAHYVARSSTCQSGPALASGPNDIGKALVFPHPPTPPPDAGPDAAVPEPTTCLVIPDAPGNTSLQWGTGGFAIFVVGRHVNAADGSSSSLASYVRRFLGSIDDATYCGGASCGHGVGLFGNSNDDPNLHPLFGNKTGIQAVFVYPATGNTTPRVLVTSTTTGYDDGAWRLYAVRRLSSGLVELGVNGAIVGQATFPPTNTDESGSLRFGELRGAIAEVIAIKGDLSDADRSAIVTGLMTSYGLK